MLKPLDKIVPAAKIDERIAQYLELRAEIEKHEAKHKKFMAQFYVLQRMIQGELLNFLDDNKIESLRTEKGTVYVEDRSTVACSDPDAFMDHVLKNGAYWLMNRTANKTGCLEFLDEHGKLPPGVRLNNMRTANVRVPKL